MVLASMLLILCIAFYCFLPILSYQVDPSPWVCIEYDKEFTPTLPSCLPGHVVDLQSVTFESTIEESCSGVTRCRLEQTFHRGLDCDRKRTCQVDINTLRFDINGTCGAAKRFYVKYRCLPVIQEQKDYLCESPTARRMSLADINLSCPRNFHIYISLAVIGLSVKLDDEQNKARFKCNKETQWTCGTSVTSAYRDICQRQLRSGYEDQCKIKYLDRPVLNDCAEISTSNYSMVEYFCIPGLGVNTDLSRVEICSNEEADVISDSRGLLLSSNDSEILGKSIRCQRRLFIPHQSRLRLFLLGNLINPSQGINLRLMNQLQMLSFANEQVDVNITNEDLLQIDWRINDHSSGKSFIYYQIDPLFPLSGKAHQEIPRTDPQSKGFLHRRWGLLIGLFLGLLLFILILMLILLAIRISRRRRRQSSSRYFKGANNDHRPNLHYPTGDHRQGHLHSSSPIILPVPTANSRPHSSTSIVDAGSDQESLIKPTRPNGDIDNFYEEIKEQQQQTALALNKSKSDYLEAKYFDQIQSKHSSSQPILDHNEVFYYECAQ